MTQQFAHRLTFVILLLCQLSICLATEIPDPNKSTKYLNAVHTFADNVLKYGRDTYGPKHTPLFVDGLNIHTREPVKWIAPNGDRWILSNLASQQNLFRTLDDLTRITGDPKYKQAAMEAIRYAFENLCSPNGLLHWGGHVAYDALADEMCTGRGTYVHELKIHYPYYELMWQVDSKATKQLIENFWSAHVLNWSNLDMNRHGSMDEQLESAWKHNYEGGPVFFESILPFGLSFNNTGSDLFYAGSMLYKLSNDKEALVWSKRLAYRYIETRDSEIGISGSQYSRCKVDRAQLQFGDDFKGHLVLEGTLFPVSPVTALALALQVRVWICQFILGDLLGPNGAEFSRWALEELTAWGKASYRKGDNSFVPMLTDGTSLLGYTFTKDGYYGPKGTVVHAMEAGPICFWAYALAYRITGDPFMWDMARSIARGNSLGDIGVSPTDQPDFETDIESSDPYALLGFLELYAKLQKKPFLRIASRIGDNILSDRLYAGFFVPSKEALYTKFDYVEPLAVLHLDAVINTRPGLTTQIWPSRSDFSCQYAGSMQADNRVIYSQTKRTELLTLLRVAAWAGRVDEVETLISKGVDVNAHCKLDSLIFQRIWGAQVGLDKWLEASLTNSTTPLHSAAEKGHKDIAELLIAKGADVNVTINDGQTALHIAIQRNRTEIVKLLIENGADVNAKDDDGQTPVDVAVSRNRNKVVKLLIAKGVDVSLHVAVRFGALAKVKSLIEEVADINAKDESGQAALHYAARIGRKGIAELLIAKGADINAKNNNGQTPVDIALIRDSRGVVKLLIEKGANVSNIHLAAYLGDVDKVMNFIEQGSDVHTKSHGGFTPLYYAAMAGSIEVSELLLSRGADIKAKDENGATPLHWGSYKGHKDMVEFLITKGADIDARDDTWSETPLHYAAYSSHKEVVELLIAKGANIHVKDKDGYTPLHRAVHAGHRDVAELLIVKGADVNAKEKDGKTPLQVAKDKGHDEIVELLRKHGAKE